MTASGWVRQVVDRLARMTGSQSRLRGLFLLGIGGFAIAAPLFIGEWSLKLLGLVLVAGGLADAYKLIAKHDNRGDRTFLWNAILSTLAGALLYIGPRQVFIVLMWIVSLAVAGYGLIRIAAALRGSPDVKHRGWTAFNGLALIVAAFVLWTLRSTAGFVVASVATGIYCFTLGWSILFSPHEGIETVEVARATNLHPDEALRLPPHPVLGSLRAKAITEEENRRPVDVFWVLTLLFTFLAIHVGRMQPDRTLVGLAGPFVATLGDLLSALLLSVVVILPLRLLWRILTRPIERRLWYRFFEDESDSGEPMQTGLGDRVVRLWLVMRLRFGVRLRLARSSFKSGLWDVIEQGLPLMAVLIAVNPIWGFSWYFNSENWASGFYQKLTQGRIDTWREGMIDSVTKAYAGKTDPARLFAVDPPGIAGSPDFSFVVIGDTGEGDSSQLILHEQLVKASQRPDVKFFLVSSDVIYPDGAMRDYELKFYLPFKGVTQPIYAIPGNHDWFTAIAGFNANFLEPEAARAANLRRLELDLNIAPHKITEVDEHIRQAARLRSLYSIRTGNQRAPFFEIQTERFALISGDTGIDRQFGPSQRAWFEQALERSKGKFVMALLGHPIYALGVDQSALIPEFGKIHRLLKKHRVPLVMAGDTHDFEYYRDESGGYSAHHFVNGGGGAYLSIGAQLDWPEKDPVRDYALYPSRPGITAKLERETPRWKWPVWWWIKNHRGWPAGVEVLSAVFDFNRAPFFQSFMEVKVEPSANRVRLHLYGAAGRLSWRDLTLSNHVMPPGASPADPVEFVIPMTSR